MANPNDEAINQQIKRTLRDSLIYVPANMIPAVVGILLIRVLTSVFTPEEYGHYQITLSTFGLIRVFSMIWLSTSVTRFYLNYKNLNQQKTFFSTLFMCTLVGTFLVAVLSWAINFFIFRQKLDPELFSLINIAIGASLFNAFFEIFVMVFRAGLEPRKYSFFWILFAVGKPILGLCLIFLIGLRVSGIFWGFFIIPLLLDIIIFRKLNLKAYIRIPSISSGLFKQFARYGLPLGLSMFSFWILSLSDRYLIGFFCGNAEVGFYSVGYFISEKTLNFIYMILMLAAYPIIVDNWEKHGIKQTQILITELTRYFFLICVPVLTVLIVIPEDVLAIFSDKKYIDGARVLPLIAIGVFLNGLTQYVMKGFELLKKSIYIAIIALLAGLTNIILNLILIPRFGFFGAGVSACTAFGIYFILSVYFVRTKMSWIPPYRSIIRIFIAAGIISVYLAGLSSLIQNTFYTVILLIPSAMLIFFIMLLILREITKYEVLRGWHLIQGIIRNT